VNEATNSAFHCLRRLSVVGGFLDGLDIEFAPGLNCIIGGRGTGKTTVLEFIRFALDAMPDDSAARKRIDALLNRNLDSGRVELGVQTRDGIPYIISRSAGEEPIVLTEDRKPTDITLKAGAFFKADIFSQNEVESIADRSLSQLDLIDNFEAEQIAEFNTQLKHVSVELYGNTNGILPLQEKIATLDEELAALPGIEEKLKGMSTTGGSDAQVINTAHELKALRDREKRTLDSMQQFLMRYGKNISELVGLIEREACTLFANDMMAGPNSPLLKEIRQSIAACNLEVDALLKSAEERVRAERARVAAETAKVGTAHTAQEMEFRALIEKHQAALGQATERSTLEKRRNELLAKKRERDEATTRLTKLQAERATLLQKLSELRDLRFSVRKAVADRINEAVRPSGFVQNDGAPSLRVTIVQDGNPERYMNLVEEALRGSRLKQGIAAQKIVNALWPVDLVKRLSRPRTSTS